jgi:hypothetical protein
VLDNSEQSSSVLDGLRLDRGHKMDTITAGWCKNCGDDIDLDESGWIAHYATGVYLKAGDSGRCPSSWDGSHHPYVRDVL